MPTQPVHRAGVTRAGLAQRQRRHRRVMRRIGGIARETGHAHHAVVLREERLQRGVIDRPVVGDAVERANPEIGRMHAGKMRGEHDRPAADPVEVGDLHRRVVVVDRIIRRPRAPVRTDVEIAVAPRFPVAAVAGEVGRLHPIALLQAKDLHLRVSARLQATAAPDAPEPMISTSTISFMPRTPRPSCAECRRHPSP